MVVNTSLVSIVVPVYNQERFIKRCLSSILRQSYNNIEVIVVNDGSTDSSLGIIEKMAVSDGRIVLINQHNQGEAIARRTGYDKAKGEYLMFVDHDDCLLPYAIESLYLSIQNTQVDVVCGKAVRKWGWKSRALNSYPDSMIGRVISQKALFEEYYISFFGVNLFPVSLWGKIYRKSVIDKAMKSVDLFTTPHLHFGGDEAFNLLLFPHLRGVYLMDETVYLYRWGGLTSGYNRHLPELLDFSDFRVHLLDQYHYDKGYSYLFIEYVNILISHVQQGLLFGFWNIKDAKEWLTKELYNRYLMRRMQNYYLGKTVIPDKCQKALSHDVDGIVSMAESRLKQQRLRFFLKKVLLRTSNN